MVDILASRYGWTYHYISEELYWEEMYEMMVAAANYSVEEKSTEYKFHYMLHANTKDAASKWKDFPLPFPATDKKSTLKEALKDETGVKQLQSLAPHIPIHKLPQRW